MERLRRSKPSVTADNDVNNNANKLHLDDIYTSGMQSVAGTRYSIVTRLAC